MQTGAALVPVFAFGENDMYDQPQNEPGTWFRCFQDLCKKIIGITPPIVKGRGFFQYSFGVIPRRCAITTVVGAPIEVDKKISPSDEEVDVMHQKFIDELTRLFESHKHNYVNNPHAKLFII